MPVAKISFFAICIFLQTNYFSFSQTPVYPIDECIKKLGAKNAPVSSGIGEALSALQGHDSAQGARLFNELEKKGGSSNKYFVARFALAKSWWLHKPGGDAAIRS